jgi:drug/metabolite transporter (DMT)-like permease
MSSGSHLQALLISLVPMVTRGVMWLFVTKAARRMEAFQAQFLFQLIGIPMLLALLPLAPRSPIPSPSGTLLLVGCSVLITFALTLYFHALKIGALAVVGPLSEASGLVVVILGVLFLHNSVYPLKIIGVAGVLLGAASLAFKPGAALRLGEGLTSLNRGVFETLLYAGAVGVYQLLVSISSRANGWYYTSLGIRLLIPLIILLVFIGQRRSLRGVFKDVPWLWVTLAALCDVLTFSSFNFALTRYELTYVAITANAAPVISVLLAVVFLRERLSWRQAAGVALVLGGVTSLNL